MNSTERYLLRVCGWTNWSSNQYTERNRLPDTQLYCTQCCVFSKFPETIQLVTRKDRQYSYYLRFNPDKKSDQRFYFYVPRLGVGWSLWHDLSIILVLNFRKTRFCDSVTPTNNDVILCHYRLCDSLRPLWWIWLTRNTKDFTTVM